MVLPGFGIISEILPVFARKPIFGYKAIAASTVAIAFLGFLTWAHHMFTAPLPEALLVFVMLSSFFIAVPTGVKILNWIATLWRGTIEYRTPLLFCAGGISIFMIGGISGIFLATFPIDWAGQRNVLRRRAPALRAARRLGDHDLRRDLLLVPEDHRAACSARASAGSASR